MASPINSGRTVEQAVMDGSKGHGPRATSGVGVRVFLWKGGRGRQEEEEEKQLLWPKGGVTKGEDEGMTSDRSHGVRECRTRHAKKREGAEQKEASARYVPAGGGHNQGRNNK